MSRRESSNFEENETAPSDAKRDPHQSILRARHQMSRLKQPVIHDVHAKEAHDATHIRLA